MTEIPEHLLKRSAAARKAAGGGGSGDDGGDGGSSDAPAAPKASAPVPAAAAAAPAVAEEKPPPPPSPMVQAYTNRRKIPWWAMAVLAGLPLWAYVYQATLEPPPAGEGPAVLGTELYLGSAACSGCHGGGGGGGTGPAFTGGAIYETWPSFVDHFEWVRLGSAGWLDEKGDTYGANNKPVGGGMPALTRETHSDAELIYIILHERELGGANPDAEDAELLELVAEYLFENEEDSLADALAEVGFEGEIPELAQGE